MYRKALTSDSLSTTTFSSIRNFPSPPLAEAVRGRAGPSGAGDSGGHGSWGREGREAGQESSMNVGEEATVVMGKGKGIKRSLGARTEQQGARGPAEETSLESGGRGGRGGGKTRWGEGR